MTTVARYSVVCSHLAARWKSRARAAAIAAARAGDLERAAHWEQVSEFLARVVMRLPAWYAALDEVKGHRAQAGGDAVAAGDHFRTAAAGFGAAGQPLDEARCSELAASVACG